MNEKLTVLVADDNKDFCDIIGQYLSKQNDIDLVGVVHDGIEALNQIIRLLNGTLISGQNADNFQAN